jgi:glycosyltransferase involved in cell wall biosynthesis
MKSKLEMSICRPVYKGSHILKGSLDSLFRQKFEDFEIIIGDDNPPDLVDEIKKTKTIIDSYNDPRIKYVKNKKNLGYATNLKNIVSKASKDIIFLLAQDDFLSSDSLQRTHDAFFLDKDVGVVTRPYFWFVESVDEPVRAVKPYDETKDAVISIFDGKREFMKIFESVGQLTGLAYRREFLTIPFNEEVFPAHIYPFAGILKEHKCVFLHDYTVAVGIMDSQTRSVSSIYDLSPTESWLKMYRSVFSGERYQQPLEWGIEHITTNYAGLVQLKNYANPGVLWNEIIVMVRNRKRNLISPRFWFYALGTLLIPRSILRRMVDWYKTRMMSESLTDIEFKY